MITSRFLPVARVTSHLRTPLYQSAYAWLFSTAASAVLGILYWVVAARYYAPEVVGVNAAIISALIFLSGISQLNLMSVLLRFIPSAGQRTAQLIGGSYGVSLLASAVLGLIGWLIMQTWPGAFSFMEVTPSFALWFILSVMVWCIFNLQDSALTGLRATIWIPIENVTYGVLKIIVLVLFAKAWPTYGIFISWVAPLLLVIIPLNILIFRRLVPRHLEVMRGAAAPIEPKRLLKYLGGNYLGSLFTLASMRLLPIIVAAQVSPSENAYFYLAWTMAGSLKLVAINMTTSLTVEGAADQAALSKHSHRFLLTLVGLFVPVLLVMVAATPYLLRLSGGDYAAEATAVLRLLTVSVLPAIVTSVYLSLARAQNQTRGIVLVQGAFCLISLLAASLAVNVYGITGVGYALLVSELLVALVLLLTELRPFLQLGFLRQNITPIKS